ncbi:MAG: AEC family transporter, partial [Rhodobacteraceae bacterium]|nr:AEC family transporter [Paracoccaceae bacterium]
MAFFALKVFRVDPFSASIMIMAAAMPTAGNIYILAQHFGVAPKRVSATILISTAVSVITLSIVIAMINGVD